MVQIKVRLDNDDHYKGGNKVEYIVIHDTGNKTDSDEGNANYFCTGSRNASAHYFVDDDSITQVVDDKNGAWHCGDGNNRYGIHNRNSIAIEQCRVNGVVTATTEKNTLDLVVMLMKKYNVPLDKVVRHYDASRKNCPSSFNLDKKWTRWYAFKDKLKAMVSQPTNSTPSDSNRQYGVVTADILNVRSGRSTSHKIIGKLKRGEKVRLDTLIGDWYSIYYGSNGGFVSAQYIKKL